MQNVSHLWKSAVLLCSLAALPCSHARAAEIVDFAWSGSAGYSATGSFIFDPASTPESFVESGAGATSYLRSFSVSFFDPANSLLESGSSIVDGISSDRFFRLEYDTRNQTVASLDADVGGSSYQYFLTNLRTPAGQVVPPGVTGFNLFSRATGTPVLDSASSIRITSVSQVPEPVSAVLVAFGIAFGIPALQRLRRRPN